MSFGAINWKYFGVGKSATIWKGGDVRIKTETKVEGHFEFRYDTIKNTITNKERVELWKRDIRQKDGKIQFPILESDSSMTQLD
jgi:hypothetical protein